MDVYDFHVLVIKPNNTIFRVEFIEICSSQGVFKERERESLYVCVVCVVCLGVVSLYVCGMSGVFVYGMCV